MQTQFDLESIDHAYSSIPNIRTVEGDPGEHTTYIFFSGNGLYYPNTDETLRTVVCQNDHYEWRNLFSNSGIMFRKAIFVRDVRKTWYCDGISPDIPDIDSLLRYLRSIVPMNSDMVCVGNSAGGYAATLFGVAMGAGKIFNVSGYALLDDDICHAPQNPALGRASADPEKAKWFDLRSLLSGNTTSEIFYFHPVDSPEDAPQCAIFSDFDRVHSFPFLSSEHGRGAPPYLLPKLFAMPSDKLSRICMARTERAWTSFSLLRSSLGLLPGLALVAKHRIRGISRKLAKKKVVAVPADA